MGVHIRSNRRRMGVTPSTFMSLRVYLLPLGLTLLLAACSATSWNSLGITTTQARTVTSTKIRSGYENVNALKQHTSSIVPVSSPQGELEHHTSSIVPLSSPQGEPEQHASIVPLDDHPHDRNDDLVQWEAPCGESTKPSHEAIRVGDLVDVKVLSKTSLGHWRGTGRWQTATVTSIDQQGQYHLADAQGHRVTPALASGIRRHHLRHAAKECTAKTTLKKADGSERVPEGVYAGDQPVINSDVAIDRTKRDEYGGMNEELYGSDPASPAEARVAELAAALKAAEEKAAAAARKAAMHKKALEKAANLIASREKEALGAATGNGRNLNPYTLRTKYAADQTECENC